MVGFDPYAGFLHEVVYNRPALGLDLMEEFRPAAIEQTLPQGYQRKRRQPALVFDMRQLPSKNFHHRPGKNHNCT
jgi:CRISPR/Cas system-associated endonuclease Cas1